MDILYIFMIGDISQGNSTEMEDKKTVKNIRGNLYFKDPIEVEY